MSELCKGNRAGLPHSAALLTKALPPIVVFQAPRSTLTFEG